jgi:hypothetical protein
MVMHVRMYVYICIHFYRSMYTYIHIYAFAYIYVNIHTYLYICKNVPAGPNRRLINAICGDTSTIRHRRDPYILIRSRGYELGVCLRQV